jgi:hypothetical protein
MSCLKILFSTESDGVSESQSGMVRVEELPQVVQAYNESGGANHDIELCSLSWLNDTMAASFPMIPQVCTT